MGFGVERAESMRASGRWGLNLLGKALVEIREKLRGEEGEKGSGTEEGEKEE